ncbi:MAG TPA: hypothetical protein VM821_04800, partial [Abditibacteriaceae bacterium]|nr:hypothetical protein [Abditibacteriaceae bacterium]
MNQTPIEYSNALQDVQPNMPNDKGAELEKTAFNFCKAATLMLLTWPLGRFALPFVAAIASVLFLGSHFLGQKTTRCVLQKPLYVGAFWAIVAGASL